MSVKLQESFGALLIGINMIVFIVKETSATPGP